MRCPFVEAASAGLRQHLVRLTVTTPMRAPGETSGSFALQSAMDELAYALRMDTVALRVVNHTDVTPTAGALAYTIFTQVAAEALGQPVEPECTRVHRASLPGGRRALGLPVERVTLELGDSALLGRHPSSRRSISGARHASSAEALWSALRRR